MIEEIEFETYLYVSKTKFQIFVFDKINKKNLYNEYFKLNEQFNFQDFTKLSKFLDENIYKIEKSVGNFIKNTNLIIKDNDNLHVNISIKKKNYNNFLNQKYLENNLTELKDLFKENYQEQTIMHMIVNSYIIDGKNYSSFVKDLISDNLCLEVNFISISKKLSIIFEKLLAKYQIKVSRYLCGNYINEYFGNDERELSIKANKLINGLNENEVLLVPKNIENKGFFERFFQLFS
tara:strand:+ start:985 stop:1689 length:705 start_codon:yes stop_codon:yes gene_type:complete